MKKALLIFCLFNSLLFYAQIDSESIDILNGISKSEEGQIKEKNNFSLIHETFDVQVLHKNEEVTLITYEVFPQLKKITKIKQVIIYNAEEKELLTQNFNSIEAKINVEDLPLGTYSIYVKTDNGQVNKQFTKKLF